jgi:NitT/TauT family transport system substrate-binding protein
MGTRVTRRACAALLLAALASPVGRRATAQQPARPLLRIALTPSDAAGQVLYARDMGFFARAGLDVRVTTDADPAAVQEAIFQQQLDIGYEDVVSLAAAHERGWPYAYIAAADVHGPNATNAATAGLLVVPRAAPIRSAKELVGKTVAVNRLDDLPVLAARSWIDHNGGDSANVKFLASAPETMLAELKAGRVDAAVIDRAVSPLAIDEVRVLASTYDGIGRRWAAAGWVTTPVWVVRHPNEAQRFNAVMKETATWANAHRRESAALLARILDRSAEQIEALPRAEYGTTLVPAMVQPVLDLCVRYGVIKQRFPAADLVDEIAR